MAGNNAIPRHRRGLRDNYDLATHADVIYFATDTAEIILNGTVYGKGASAESVDNVLRLLALKQDLLTAGQLIRIYTDTQGVLRIGTDRPMDSAVTPESANFISSGAVYSAISAAEERVNEYFREALGLTPEQIVALNKLAQELEEYPDFVEGITSLVQQKQDNLVSGVNIKTVNGMSLLGSGNVSIESLRHVFLEEDEMNALTAETAEEGVIYFGLEPLDVPPVPPAPSVSFAYNTVTASAAYVDNTVSFAAAYADNTVKSQTI